MRLAVLLLAAATILAGCSQADGHPHAFTCDDGTQIEYGNQTTHHDEGFDPSTLCAPPPLVVQLQGAPETMTVYDEVTLSFVLELGGRDHAHSMDLQIRVATAPAAPGPADGPDTYGAEVGRVQHQDLPVSFDAVFAPVAPGTYYLRAVALVDGSHIWSNETQVEVAPVEPTGTTFTITHAAGDFAGGVSPAEADAELGDALVFQNDDLVAHTFTFISGPLAGQEVTVEAGSASEPLLLDEPGVHDIQGDDLHDAPNVRVRVA